MNNEITFKELAAVSNVGIGTLSRYFNGGYVSEEKKKRIKKNIEKYKYVRNLGASKVKKKSGTIIIRTFLISRTQDNIISGIMSILKNDAVVKYSDHTEKKVIKSIEWALEQRPENIIIFSPTNASTAFSEILKRIRDYQNTVVFNYENQYVPNVEISYDKAYEELSKSINEINFVYYDKQDKHSYKERLRRIKKYFDNVVVSKTISKTKVNIFQTENLRRQLISNDMSIANKTKIITTSYEKPLFTSSHLNQWIFIDSFLVGVTIAKSINCKPDLNVIIEGENIKK